MLIVVRVVQRAQELDAAFLQDMPHKVQPHVDTTVIDTRLVLNTHMLGSNFFSLPNIEVALG